MATHPVFFPGEPCEQYELRLYHCPIPNSWLSCGQDQGQGCCPMTYNLHGGLRGGLWEQKWLEWDSQTQECLPPAKSCNILPKKKECDFINHFPIPKYGILEGANQVEMRCLFIKCLFGDAHPGWSYLWPSLLPWIMRWLTFSFFDPVLWLNRQGW